MIICELYHRSVWLFRSIHQKFYLRGEHLQHTIRNISLKSIYVLTTSQAFLKNTRKGLKRATKQILLNILKVIYSNIHIDVYSVYSFPGAVNFLVSAHFVKDNYGNLLENHDGRCFLFRVVVFPPPKQK